MWTIFFSNFMTIAHAVKIVYSDNSFRNVTYVSTIYWFQAAEDHRSPPTALQLKGNCVMSCYVPSTAIKMMRRLHNKSNGCWRNTEVWPCSMMMIWTRTTSSVGVRGRTPNPTVQFPRYRPPYHTRLKYILWTRNKWC